MNRRKFIEVSVKLAGAALLSTTGFGCALKRPGEHVKFEKLPYALNALEPFISEQTVSVHYGKHHKTYVENARRLVRGTKYASRSLEDLLKNAGEHPGDQGLFNNAAQVFNHTCYWNSMKPGGGGEPEGILAEAVERSFGSYQKFAKAFTQSALSQFGSGWTWLVADGSELKIINTSNAGTPHAQGMIPILVLDVWEHAYYLDYRNRRDEYVRVFLENLVNWGFAEEQMSALV